MGAIARIAAIAAWGMCAASAAAVRSETPPKPKSSLSINDLERDIRAQKEQSDLDANMAHVDAQIERAKRLALSLKLLRARVKDFLDNKECAGGQKYLADLDASQRSTKVLLSELGNQCKGTTSDISPNLGKACEDERLGLMTELNALEQSRRNFERSCIKPSG